MFSGFVYASMNLIHCFKPFELTFGITPFQAIIPSDIRDRVSWPFPLTNLNFVAMCHGPRAHSQPFLKGHLELADFKRLDFFS
jgi:hypothetical protein